MEERLRKWRLILGKDADPEGALSLSGKEKGIDGTLEALYNGSRKGGLGKSTPAINRWLGDIRKYFPTAVVQLMQKDALERLGLDQMLLEPELLEAVEPDIHLVSTLLSLNKVLPDKSRDSARMVVRKVVKELEQQLRLPLEKAIRGSLSRSIRNTRPRLKEIDWNRTIQLNLKHYQPEYKSIIPERLLGYGRKQRQLKHVILLTDQSGSMAASVVYASVVGSILASLSSIRTHLIVFDTKVVDLTEYLQDPVDVLFAAQLGGGTDIFKAIQYAQTLIDRPSDTVMILISDLFEGGSSNQLLQQILQLKVKGVQFISLLALNDQGAPAYNEELATALASIDIPAFACTPDLFPSLMAAALQKEDLYRWLSVNEQTPK